MGLVSVILQNTIECSYLDNLYVHGVQAFTAVLYLERYAVVLADLVNQTTHVNEDFFTAFVWLNETKTFSFIKELYCTFLHCKKL